MGAGSRVGNESGAGKRRMTRAALLSREAALPQLDAERDRVQQAIVLTLDRRAAALLADDDAQVEALDREIDQLHRDLERADLIERRLLAGTISTEAIR
jgi:hypothetical protein